MRAGRCNVSSEWQSAAELSNASPPSVFHPPYLPVA